MVAELKQVATPPQLKQAQPLLEQFLSGKKDVFKSKVLNLVVKTGLDVNDPVFLLLIGMAEMEELIIDSPTLWQNNHREFSQKIEQIFDCAEEKIVKVQQDRLKQSIEEQKTAIATAANELVRQTAKNQNRANFFKVLVPAMGVITLAMGLGAIATLGWQKVMAERKDPRGAVQLTLEEATALQWAMTPEGKYARNLMKWNGSYLDTRKCQEDAAKLGLKFKWGQQQVGSGFCFLWVDAPTKHLK